MNFGILSDTHDNGPNMLKALDIFAAANVKFIFHAGDWASPTAALFFDYHKKERGLDAMVISVFGNNDGDRHRFHQFQDFEAEGKQYTLDIEHHIDFFSGDFDRIHVALLHGESPDIVRALIASQKYDLLISGHDHTARISQEGRTTHVNPGTLSALYLERIIYPSVALYDTGLKKAEIVFFPYQSC